MEALGRHFQHLQSRGITQTFDLNNDENGDRHYNVFLHLGTSKMVDGAVFIIALKEFKCSNFIRAHFCGSTLKANT